MFDVTRHRPPIYHENSGADGAGRRTAAYCGGPVSARGRRARSAHRTTISPPPFAS
jgi:hypothetical protein